MLHLILGGAAPGPQHARSWRDGVERFTAAITGVFSVSALQSAEKLKFRIRASLQRCRKFLELRCPFRGCAPKHDFFSNRLLALWKCSFGFDPADLPAEPVAQGLFDLFLCAGAVEGFDRLTFVVERNESARHIFLSEFRGNQLRQQAINAGMGPGGIPKVQAAWRILKNVRGTPGRQWRVTVPALFQELQLEPQDFKNVAIFVWHSLYRLAGVRGARRPFVGVHFLVYSIPMTFYSGGP